MKFLLLGKGVSNDGAMELLIKFKIEFDYYEIAEVEDFNIYDSIIKSPGISLGELDRYNISPKIPIIGEIELVSYFYNPFVIGVTGTNGKTTVVKMLEGMLSAKYKTKALGNIGTSYAKYMIGHEDLEIAILELSSFQLESMKNFKADIAILTNLHPHHLDHHETFMAYYEAKSKITLSQDTNNYFIYPFEDIYGRMMARNTLAKTRSFSNESILADTYVFKNKIYFRNKFLIRMKDIPFRDDYLVNDLLCALTCASLLKIKRRSIKSYLKKYQKVEFRFQKVDKNIYNDGKSTNPYATIAALHELSNVTLLSGGYDRKEDLSCLKPYLNKITKVLSYGDTRYKIYDYFTSEGIKCVTFNTIAEALEYYFKNRNINDILLFSPMFASFDQYPNYIARSLEFNKLIDEYKKMG